MAATESPAPDLAGIMPSASTPSGIPLDTASPQEALQELVLGTLADVLTNPNSPLGDLMRDQAGSVPQIANPGGMTYWQRMTQPVPGQTPTYYLACTGGCVSLAGVNYYAAWALPPEQKLFRIVSFLQGTALIAAAAINLQKAQKAR